VGKNETAISETEMVVILILIVAWAVGSVVLIIWAIKSDRETQRDTYPTQTHEPSREV
jgi:flagellar basal body-associated protein FliL